VRELIFNVGQYNEQCKSDFIALTKIKTDPIIRNLCILKKMYFVTGSINVLATSIMNTPGNIAAVKLLIHN
jgi:hypothetical protein